MSTLLPQLLLTLSACTKDAGLTTFNNEPEALITSHADGDSVAEGMPSAFLGSVSDPDHPTTDLVATWFLGTEVLCEAAPPDGDGRVQCEATLGIDDTVDWDELRRNDAFTRTNTFDKPRPQLESEDAPAYEEPKPTRSRSPL